MYDGRGSVSNMSINSGGNIVTYTYDAYGVTTKTNASLNNPYQYNAEYTDSSTNNQYLRARYYDPSQGRFLTKDTELGSIEKPITRNLYIYCGNNPLNYTDPSGHGWFKNAWNGVKKTATKAVNAVKSGYNTVKNWTNTHVVQPVKSFISNTKQSVSNAYNKGKACVTQKYNQAKQSYNNVKAWVNNKTQQLYNDYVSPKIQKAIEEAKRFVCTTKNRISTTWDDVTSWSQKQIKKLKSISHGSQTTHNSPEADIEQGSAYAYGYRGEVQGYYGNLQGSAYAYGAYTRVDAELSAMASVVSGDASVGFVIGGYEIDLGVRGHAVAAGANANISIESGKIDINADVAAFIGFGFDVGIKKYDPVYQ